MNYVYLNDPAVFGATTSSVGDPPGDNKIPIIVPSGPLPAALNMSQTQAAIAASDAPVAPVGGSDRIVIPEPGKSAVFFLFVLATGLAAAYYGVKLVRV